MVLSPKEELLQLIEKLPESKVERVLNIVKQEQQKNTSDNFFYDNLLKEVDIIFKEDDNLLKRLAQ